MSKYRGSGGGGVVYRICWDLMLTAKLKRQLFWSTETSDSFFFILLPLFFFLRQNYIPGNDCSDIKLKWSKPVLLHQYQLLKGQVPVMNVWYLPISLICIPGGRQETIWSTQQSSWHFRGLWSCISRRASGHLCREGSHLMLLWQAAFGPGYGAEEVFVRKCQFVIIEPFCRFWRKLS